MALKLQSISNSSVRNRSFETTSFAQDHNRFRDTLSAGEEFLGERYELKMADHCFRYGQMFCAYEQCSLSTMVDGMLVITKEYLKILQ